MIRIATAPVVVSAQAIAATAAAVAASSNRRSARQNGVGFGTIVVGAGLGRREGLPLEAPLHLMRVPGETGRRCKVLRHCTVPDRSELRPQVGGRRHLRARESADGQGLARAAGLSLNHLRFARAHCKRVIEAICASARVHGAGRPDDFQRSTAVVHAGSRRPLPHDGSR